MTFRIAPNGFQSTEIGLIPDDWKIKQVKEISGCIVPGRNKPKKFDGAIPWVTTSDIDELGRINNSKISLFISKEEAHSIGSKVVPYNSVIMSCVGELGVVAVVEDEIVINQQLHAFLPHAKINSKYLSYVLSSLREYFYGKATKTTLPYLNKDNCNSTPIPLPCFEEQTAIANALSDVDALLTELEKLVAKKQAIKTATMQQLLTGKTRLPQFPTYTEGEKQGQPKGTKPSELGEIPEDWDVVSLGDIGNTVIGLTYSPNDVAEYGTLVLRSSNVQKNTLAYENNVFVDMDLPERVIVKEGDILVCVRNGSRNLIGKCALIDKYAEGSAFGAFMSIYRTKQSKFIFFQFQSNVIQNQINEIMGATINQITNKDMAAFKVPLPSDEKEQTAIATILSDMDNEIQTLEQRLAKTRQIKQGMMQELLTGRTRLPFNKAAQQGN